MSNGENRLNEFEYTHALNTRHQVLCYMFTVHVKCKVLAHTQRRPTPKGYFRGDKMTEFKFFLVNFKFLYRCCATRTMMLTKSGRNVYCFSLLNNAESSSGHICFKPKQTFPVSAFTEQWCSCISWIQATSSCSLP